MNCIFKFKIHLLKCVEIISFSPLCFVLSYLHKSPKKALHCLVIITLFNYSSYFIFLTCHRPGRMRVVTCFHWVMAPRVGLVVGQTGLFCIAQISRTAKTHYSCHHLSVKVHLKKPINIIFSSIVSLDMLNQSMSEPSNLLVASSLPILSINSTNRCCICLFVLLSSCRSSRSEGSMLVGVSSVNISLMTRMFPWTTFSSVFNFVICSADGLMGPVVGWGGVWGTTGACWG